METRIARILKNSADPLRVRKTTASVFNELHFVNVDYDRIQEFSKDIKKRAVENKVLTSDQFGSRNPSAQLVFIFDTVNFCFWAHKGKEKWMVEYPNGNIIPGGWYSFVACFNRAISEGKPILEAKYLHKLSLEEAKNIFRSATSTELPLLKGRVQILNEVGGVLESKFNGKFGNLLDNDSPNADNLMKKVLENFPSFADQRNSDGRKINFYKRLQILAYDLSMLPGLKISNLDHLTSFAEYKVPQMLRLFSLMDYHKPLADKVDNYILLDENSREEIEIRSATVWICELIAYEIDVYPVLTDNIIWTLAQEYRKAEIKPYHRTITTSY